jgi:hypothetical protein
MYRVMARTDDAQPDPRLSEFIEILAEALVLDYRRQLAAEQRPEPAHQESQK